MPAFICPTCGTQYAPSDKPPATCTICTEDRQYVLPTGQTWTTLDAMKLRYCNWFHLYEPNLFGIGTTPQFGIGQRALLVRAPGGNILWDCIAFLDGATVEIAKALGGISAIAISHPHYYTTMVEWSRAFGDIPIHLHASDRQWIMRPDPAVKLWDGDTLSLGAGLTLIRCGGHYAGGTVLHWAAGAGGRGALLSGDIVQCLPVPDYVTFMRSYPNMVPLSAPAVERIGRMLDPYPFDPIYGAFYDRRVPREGKVVLKRSIDRYVAAVRGDGSAELQ